MKSRPTPPAHVSEEKSGIEPLDEAAPPKTTALITNTACKAAERKNRTEWLDMILLPEVVLCFVKTLCQRVDAQS